MKIAIAGYGLEGEASFKYFSTDKRNKITIADQHRPICELPEGVSTIFGENAFEKLQGFDLVVRTAGLAPRKIKTDGKIWSATNEFFAKCPAMIIGVTGSKGKGTTASLIASILREAGKKVWLLGNIGVPSLDVLSKIKTDDIVVYELSSFQLWDLEKSPHVAVVLFIEVEHQDIHLSMDEYVLAKSNITTHQTRDDILVYNSENKYARLIAKKTKAHTVGYLKNSAAHVKDGYFWHGEQKMCSTKVLRLPGLHNQDNACAAIDAVWQLTQDIDTIAKGLSAFSGLPHRLQLVRRFEDVDYYDDSIATTPSSTIAAIKSFSGPKVLIMGGSYKGSDFSELAKEVKKHDTTALLIGDEAQRIAKSFQDAHFTNFEIIDHPTMAELVKKAHDLAKPGGLVLLSPAAASFGLFKNYVDRGEQYQKAVNALGN